MIYSENFKKCVEYAIKMASITGEFYIGTGNPDSKILIIGKECGFDPVINKRQYITEIVENHKHWKNNISVYMTIERLTKDNTNEYNPLFPYWNWNLKVSNWHTWSKYKKLLSYIKDQNVCLHKESFLTELNHVPSKRSKKETKLSDKRIEFIKNLTFFQNFKIVILACRNYLSKEEIQDLFSVKYKEEISVGKRKMKIYHSDKKIVINSNQLSGPLSNEYLKKIAEKVKDYYYI